MPYRARFLTEATRLTVVVLVYIASVAMPSAGRAQSCDPQWIPNGASQMVSGIVNCFANFDPDGSGPQPTWFIIGGRVRVPGLGTHKILGYNGTTWAALENTTPASSEVHSMAVYNGELIIAGSFSSVAGVTTNNIAKWNGTTWTPVGTGIQSSVGISTSVNSLAVLNGYLFAGGYFNRVNPSVVTSGIARWDGTNWASIGALAGGSSGSAQAVLAFQGDLYVGGSFASAGGVAATNLARYNTTTGVWSPHGNPNADVRALEQYTGLAFASARLYVGGTFTSIGGIATAGAVRYSPSATTWTSLGTPVAGASCNHLFVRSTGISSHQVAAVWNWAGGGDLSREAFVLNSTTWNSINGASPSNCYAISVHGGQYVVGRSTELVYDEYALLRWNDAQWAPLNQTGMLGTGTQSLVFEPTTGDLIAGVTVLDTSGNPFNTSIARRASTTGVWTFMDGTFELIQSEPSNINAIVVSPSGVVYAGGRFALIDGNPVANIARWNGTGWVSLGTGVNGTVYALLTIPNGDLIVAGDFTEAGGVARARIARWNGMAWSSLAEGIPANGSYVFALAQLPNGNLIAGGDFLVAGGVVAHNIAQWNGTTWTTLGSGTNGRVHSLASTSDGSVYVGGVFSTAGGVPAVNLARWNGSAWSALPPLFDSWNNLAALHVLPDDSLLVGGTFWSGSIPTQNIVRLKDSTWSGVDGGVSEGSGGASITSLALLPSGRVAVGGEFLLAGGENSAYFALLDIPSNCGCDSIDFNNDTSLFDPQDIEAFLSVYSEGPCVPASATCNDIDFNNDTSLFDPCDIDSFLVMYSEGPCTPCGQ